MKKKATAIFLITILLIPNNFVFANKDTNEENGIEIGSNEYKDYSNSEPIISEKEATKAKEPATEQNDNVIVGNEEQAQGSLDKEGHNLELKIIEKEDKNIVNFSVQSQKYVNGDEGEHVVELKLKLRELGFGKFPSNPSPRYGDVTENVVREFQRTVGLNVTGIADQLTLNKLDELINSNYRNGKTGPHVKELKKNLSKLGFGNFPSNPSENYGTVTERVVKEFQEYYRLPTTGIADQATLDKIMEILQLPYKEGHRGEHILELKKNLSKMNFGNFSSNPSIYYDNATVQAVKEFQKAFGLTQTGETDQATLNKIDEILKSPYQNGKTGEHVRELKLKLRALGFGKFPSNPSINYGNVTSRVVREFQEYYGLPATGIVDEQTLNKLNEVYNSTYRNGIEGEHIRDLKIKLREIGFGNFPSNPSNKYGDVTEKVVREFQIFFGLKVTGEADKATLEMLDEAYEKRFVDKSSGKHVVQLKKNLTRLGFGRFPINPSENFGPVTMGVIKEFQEYYNLPKKKGELDKATINKMVEILDSAYQNGKKGPHVKQLKLDLKKLGFGNFPKNPSENYGTVTERVVKEFQEYYGLKVSGIADEITLQMIELASKGIKYTKYNITLEEALDMQMKVKPQTDNRKYAWVHSDYIDSNNKVTASALRVRTQPSTSKDSEVIGTLSKGTKVNIVGIHGNWYAIDYTNGYHLIHATKDDTLYYLNPNNFINDKKQRFQFLDLSKPSGATKYDLNKFLKGKGVLEGKGQAFIDAARIHRINDIYLISHALHETGNGNSDLAKGIEVGKNSNKQPVLVTSSNKNSLTKIKTVHNVYGIGARDICPEECGAITAYNNGWFTVEDAIIGGAAFIGNNYIKAGQNTLYKMRWNPQAMVEQGEATHQYATDIGWASKQVDNMYKLYQEIGINTLYLDIPQYK